MDYTNKWEASYRKKENFIYYPKEEVVKFLNRFVRKRTGVDSFKDIIGTNLKGLDLGCGIGRQTILLEEFNIEAYGLDISETAISQARKLAQHFGYTPVFQVLQQDHIPFNDNFFNVAICDSVLDSMPFHTAQEYMRELDRTVTDFLYVSLFAGGGGGGNKGHGARERYCTGLLQFTEDTHIAGRYRLEHQTIV